MIYDIRLSPMPQYRPAGGGTSLLIYSYSLYRCHQLLYVRTAAAGGGDCGLTSKYSVKVSPTAGTVSLRRLSHYQQLAGLAASRLKMEFDECLVAEIHVASQLR